MKILIVQNRKGIGDLIIFLPFIEALAKKFTTQVYLLVKENSKIKVLTVADLFGTVIENLLSQQSISKHFIA